MHAENVLELEVVTVNQHEVSRVRALAIVRAFRYHGIDAELSPPNHAGYKIKVTCLRSSRGWIEVFLVAFTAAESKTRPYHIDTPRKVLEAYGPEALESIFRLGDTPALWAVFDEVDPP